MRKDCLLGVVAILATACLPGSAAAQITFNKDVLPIVQQHCQMCHRPGEVAPFSLLTFNDARPWARAIKTAVLTQAKKLGPELEARKADLAASTQAAIVEVLVKKSMRTGASVVVVFASSTYVLKKLPVTPSASV